MKKEKIRKALERLYATVFYRKYVNCDRSAHIGRHVRCYNPKNLVMEEETNVDRGAIIMNTRARLVFKKWSGAATGLLAVTGNHMSVPGLRFNAVTDAMKQQLDSGQELDRDIIVEEDVWISANVTLLSGVRIGRGGVVGSGSVVRMSTPPYAIVTGNPAKVVGFRFTPEETIEHEKALFPESERLEREVLERNYNKYFLSRIRQIKEFVRL